MRFKMVGNKADSLIVVVRNGEASAAIPAGTPLTLKLNGTNDGLDVVLPNTATDANNGAFKYGVATATIANGAYGEAVVFGLVTNAVMTKMTRATTTDSWSSSQSSASGIALGYDSLNNAFVGNASMVGSLGTLFAQAALASSLSSGNSSASATSDTRTAITTAARVFVRMM